MSSRERWIVFPLLFLALGISLRDKLIPPSRTQAVELQADSVTCQRLTVVDEAKHVVVHLGAVDKETKALLDKLPPTTALAVGSDGKRYGVFMKLPGRDEWNSMGLALPVELPPQRAAPGDGE